MRISDWISDVCSSYLLSLGSPVGAVAIGDVTGDGRDDVVASTHQFGAGGSNPDDFKLSVFVQQADGRLASPLQAPFPGFSMHTENKSIVLVDLDEDGLREIVLGYGEIGSASCRERVCQ